MSLPEIIAANDDGHNSHHEALHAAYNLRPQELDYAENISAIVAQRTSSGVTDAPGLTVSYEFDGATPIIIESVGHVSTNNIGVIPLLVIRDSADNANIALAWGGSMPDADHFSTNHEIRASRRFVPPAGVKTYKVGLQYVGTSGGTVQLQAADVWPAYVRMVSVDAV